MVPDDKVFQLVKSLRGPERAFIHVFAVKEEVGKTKTVVLFEVFCEAVDAMEEYDEDWIRNRLKERKENEIRKQLAVYKTRLYAYILKVMRVFNTKKNIKITLRECIEDIVFLIAHGLYSQAVDILGKIKNEAWRYEQYWALLELLDIERRLIYDTTEGKMKEKIYRNIEEVRKVMDAQQVEHELRCLYHLLFTQLRLQLTGKPVDEELIREIEQHELLQDESRITTFFGRRYLYGIRSMLCRIAADDKGCFEYELQMFNLWSAPEHRHFVEDDPQACMRFLSNFGGLCVRLSNREYYNKDMRFFADIPLRNKDDEAEKFQDMMYLQLLWLNNVDDSGFTKKFLNELIEGMVKFDEKINDARKLTLYYLLLCYFFMKGAYCSDGEYGGAIVWAGKIFKMRSAGIRGDIQVATALMYAVCSFEEGEEDPDNVYRRMERHIRTHRPSHSRLYPHEKCILVFIRKVPGFRTKEDKEQARRVQEAVEEVLVNPEGKSTLGLRELWYWIESGITGRPPKNLYDDGVEPNQR